MADLVAEIEDAARRRYVRWDAGLWRRVVEGPARTLAAALREDASAAPVLESYLRLAAEGIGLGYLFPPEVGDGFFTHAFFRLVPEALAGVPPERRARVLAECWNLGENLEHAPAWWRRMFVRLASDGAALEALPALVERASREAFRPPPAKLGGRSLHLYVDLGAEDRLFLPGAVHFVAPTVACVHDRDAPGGRSLGAWLVDPPLVLGAMGCREAPGPTSDRLDLVDDLVRKDPCAGDVRNSAANDWRAALTLETSQFLVGIYPA
ncbi:MAG: hypothetical protein U0599_26150 [Vicinamibacteria bacterium]